MMRDESPESNLASRPATQNDPLSFAQDRLWFLEQLGVGSAYNEAAAVTIRGPLNVDAITSSVGRLLERHEILRTRFLVESGQPRQIAGPAPECPLDLRDLSGAPGSFQQETVQRELQQSVSETFNLARGPLFRPVLFKLSDNEHVLLIVLHHIVTDGWSARLINREIAAGYDAASRGVVHTQNGAVVQYADFARRQRDGSMTETLQQQLAYWRGKLSGIETLQLPIDYARPAAASFRGSQYRFSFSSATSVQLTGHAREHGVTPFMFLLAAFQSFLHRLTGQKDIVVASPTAGRTNPQLNETIGFFVNTLLLRANFTEHVTFKELLRTTRLGILEALDNQDAPLEKLVAELQPERTLSRQPLFQVAFAWENFPKEPLQLRGLECVPLHVEQCTAKFDLTLHMRIQDGEFRGEFEYATDLFERATIERFGVLWQRLVDSILERPEQPIGTLSWLSDSDRSELLESFNDFHLEFRKDRLVHEIFEERVEALPDAIAVIDASRRLTYRELNSRANKLARFLKSKGVGPERLVGISLCRGVDLVVGLLGILKAGAAYVPVDPMMPAVRIREVISDADPILVITDSLMSHQMAQTAKEAIIIDVDWPEIASHESHNLGDDGEDGRSSRLAYVIYTSGSTGTPKGVMVEHRSLHNLVAWHSSTFGIIPGTRSSSMAGLGFDASTWEIWPSLCSGGQLLMAPHESSGDPQRLLQWWCEQELDISFLVTPLAERAYTSRMINLHVRKVLIGGDRLYAWPEAIPASQQLINNYGPTEATVVATSGRIASGERIHIGRPIANTRIYILDAYQQPVPIGVAGEIFIGGEGVARGYLHRAERTRERFVPDPFRGDAKSRMYKTGDLGRWRANGTIEFLGRNDNQVKIRGYRIELDEVTARLLGHASIKEAVVVSRGERVGETQLVAYVVPDHQEVNTAAERDSVSQSIVARWKTLYEDTYSGGAQGPSFVGWNSSETGQPIPESEMREWLGCTVQRIRDLKPQRVLEIGCGVGLLVEQLAPHCKAYVGTDVSASAVDRLKRWVSERHGFSHVALLQRSATEISDLKAQRFDTIILNSVVQYFPSVDYLVVVLTEAMKLLAQNGAIFVGDVRHFGLLHRFHSEVQFCKASPTAKLQSLRVTIDDAVAFDKELSIDPGFFQSLTRDFPRISAIYAQPRRGYAHNELSRYRYDVIVHTDPNRSVVEASKNIKWADVGSLAVLEERLAQRTWRAIKLTEFPNSRLIRSAYVEQCMRTSADSVLVQEARRKLPHLTSNSPELEELARLCSTYGYELQVSLADDGGLDHLEAIIIDPLIKDHVYVERKVLKATGSYQTYANNPLASGLARDLIPRIREYMHEVLPSPMVPAVWVVLEKLPVSPSGKIDHRALPAPRGRSHDQGQYVPPRTRFEAILARVWAGLLGIDRVGAEDHFFQLGGHSLLIVQMREVLQKEGLSVAMRDIYANPKLADLAGALAISDGAERLTRPNLIPLGCRRIIPAMVPLVELTQEQIDTLVSGIPDGSHNIEDLYPLTPLQEGILFHHLFKAQGGDPYVVSILLSVSSRQQLERVAVALQAVIDAHGVLRTAFFWKELPRPVQVVHRRALLPMTEVTLESGRPPLEQAREWLNPDKQWMDLQNAPLVRLKWARDPNREECYALLQFHHLVSDHESLERVIREIVSQVRGEPRPTERSAPYRHHVEEVLENARTERADRYFRSKLGDIEEPTVPFALSDIHGDGSQIDELTARVEPGLAMQIRAQARRLSVSAATLFHAAWALVVSRASCRSDVTFGTVLLGRLQGSAAGKRAMGMFINMLPIRLRLEGLSAEELISATARNLAELLDYEQTSLDVVQRLTRLPPSTPLFSSVMNYRHSAPRLEAELETVAGLKVLAGYDRSNYPITMAVDDLGEGFSLVVQADRRLVQHPLIDYLVTAISSLVEALERDPRVACLELEALPIRERRRLITEFNRVPVLVPLSDKLIHELFEDQVSKTPEAVALRYEAQFLSFKDLEFRANQLARHLRSKGIGPSRLVGICLERGLDMVVALLGVLKAGGAYVPLDPDYPRERLAFMLQDSNPLILVTSQRLKPRLPSSYLGEHLCIDREWESTICFESGERISRSSSPENLAYVIYTSGSTGTPKGAMNQHRGMVNRILAQQQVESYSRTDKCCQKTSLSFVDSVFEIFGPLCQGCSLTIVPTRSLRSPSEIATLVAQQGITHLLTVPSLARSMTDDKQIMQNLSGLRIWTLSGEAVHPDLLRSLHGRLPNCEFIVQYGSSEVSSDAAIFRVRSFEGDRVPLGSPLPNVQLYILDAQKKPVPIGVRGEIYVGGVGVGLGYLGRPELTNDRFMSDPFGPCEGARMYRTGDLGRWTVDGRIEYLGRNDHQVKIRGIRVELGELESLLLSHAEVQEAAILAREDSAGEMRLVAYVVRRFCETPMSANARLVSPNDDARPEGCSEATASHMSERRSNEWRDQLREYLRARVPDYLIPSSWVILERLPLTPNGKVDRRALPAPPARPVDIGDYVPPRSDIESSLAAIWSEVLRVDQVGIKDNFFELGGSSLTIVRISARIAARLGVDLEARLIFACPTIETLASAISAATKSGTEFEEGVI